MWVLLSRVLGRFRSDARAGRLTLADGEEITLGLHAGKSGCCRLLR
jgi:hypothetical protein